MVSAKLFRAVNASKTQAMAIGPVPSLNGLK